jgi:uncharacterized membrane protein YhaH (DUF805 family)
VNLLFSFAGRIGRGKFWLGVLAQILLSIVGYGAIFALVPFDQLVVTGPDGLPVLDALGNPEMDLSNPAAMPAWIIGGVMAILGIWWSLAVAVKRCHDRGKSGWWCLLILIPLVGVIWWLVDLGILEGEEGPNKWGPNPVAQSA